MDSAEMQAQLDALMKEYQKSVAEFEDFQRKLTEMGATVKAKNGMITVRVGHQGQLTGLELDPRIYKKLSATELAEAILAAAQEAAGRVADELRNDMGQRLAEELTSGGPVDGVFDLLPQRPEDLEGFMKKYGIGGSK